MVADAAAPSPSLVGTRGGQVVAIVGAAGGEEADRVAHALARLLGKARPRTPAGQALPGTPAGQALPGTAAGQALPGTAAGQARPGTGPEQARQAIGPGPARMGPGTARTGPGAGDPPPWRIVVGRPYPGPSGVTRSFEEAEDALDVAQRLGLPEPVASVADLLIYQVLLRDRAAITDLVRTVLMPLAGARGGAAPLLATLAAYFARGGVAAAAARDLHLSVRAVTYRLARVRDLTGRDPGQPADALTLRVAVIGARLLDWPATPLAAA